jgi:hypothetical protein
MSNARRCFSLLIAIAMLATMASYATGEGVEGKVGTGFTALYKPVSYTVNPSVKGYALPLPEGAISPG